MMRSTKTKFVGEYPINASARLLYPYLSSASGLAEWFCDDVKVDSNKIYNFLWDGRSHYAELTSYRTNRSVRFLFLNDKKMHTADPAYVDEVLEAGALRAREEAGKVLARVRRAVGIA